MYIRIKFFENKKSAEFNKPLFKLEVDGVHAIELCIVSIIKKFLSESKGEKIKAILQGED